MITFLCNVCKSSLSMDDEYAGKPVRCPTCQGVVKVPERRVAAVPVPPRRTVAPPPPPGGSRESVRRFGFNCPWCSSRLEATMLTAGQHGQCPTCANDIRIPIIDRYGRLIDPDTNKIVKPDPHPVHAYAAAGDRAPKILRDRTGAMTIQCVRCNALNPVAANSCRACGVPFTLEGTVQREKGYANGYATTSLVLGVLGIPTCLIFVPSVLAIIFGIIALVQINASGGAQSRGTAIWGISLGVLGLLISVGRLAF
jgi:hypothetical protein